MVIKNKINYDVVGYMRELSLDYNLLSEYRKHYVGTKFNFDNIDSEPYEASIAEFEGLELQCSANVPKIINPPTVGKSRLKDIFNKKADCYCMSKS
jgi:hypothetical protein